MDELSLGICVGRLIGRVTRMDCVFKDPFIFF